MTPRTLTNIQILRGLAAVNVVVFHTIEASKSYSLPVERFRFMDGWGLNGVDLFFVISGFVMVYIQSMKNRTPIEFYKDRIFRIVPIYWILSLFIAVLLFFLPNFFRQMSFSASWLLSSLFFFSGLIHAKMPILYLGWTIEFEMFFYAIFGTALYAKKLIQSIAWTFGLIVLAVLLGNANAIILEFIFGMTIGWIFLTRKLNDKVAILSLFIGTLAFLGSIWVKDSGLDRVLIYGLPSLLIVYGCVNLNQVKTGVLTKMGDASYSIYLIQVFTIPVFYKIFKMNEGRLPDFDLLAIISILGTTLAGYLFYLAVELPISRKINVWKNLAKVKLPS